MKQALLGYEVHRGISSEIAAAALTQDTGRARCRWLACINPHSYAVARQDVDFCRALQAADWLVPDGVGIIMAGAVMGTPVGPRVTGADIFGAVMSRLDGISGRVFFLGSTESTLQKIRERVREDYPQVVVGGVLSPPFADRFSESENEQMIKTVNEARCDVLWVGLTAPKQEKWLHANHGRLKVRFAGAIGAVFDFYAGRIQRPPKIIRSAGMEWLGRLIQEPRRLWRRSLVSAPIFLRDVGRARLGRRVRNDCGTHRG